MDRVVVLRAARSAALAPHWAGSLLPGERMAAVRGARSGGAGERRRCTTRLSKNMDAAFNGFSFWFGGRSWPTTTFCASESRA
jgi:hypothetical protein